MLEGILICYHHYFHCDQDGDHVMQGQAAAAQALEEAMAATREAAQRVDATVSILRQVQVPWAFRSLVLTHSRPVHFVYCGLDSSQLIAAVDCCHEIAASAKGCDNHSGSANMPMQVMSQCIYCVCLAPACKLLPTSNALSF